MSLYCCVYRIPNITAYLLGVRSNDLNEDNSQALFWKFSSEFITTIHEGSGKDQIGFDASRSNSVYNGSTVKPQSLSVLALIRI